MRSQLLHNIGNSLRNPSERYRKIIGNTRNIGILIYYRQYGGGSN